MARNGESIFMSILILRQGVNIGIVLSTLAEAVVFWSGQTGQTVNLLARPSEVHALSLHRYHFFQVIQLAAILKPERYE